MILNNTENEIIFYKKLTIMKIYTSRAAGGEEMGWEPVAGKPER